MTKNPFVKKLLSYSPERDDSIGRPERWDDPPPLVVETPLHDEMERLASELWSGPTAPIWYFLVGGPGNGKSEAIGAFVRAINSLSTAEGFGKVLVASAGKDGGEIDYEFQASLKNHGELLLLQDVSVPRKRNQDPARNLLEALSLYAGQNVIACANRGMLLRALRIARTDSNYQPLLPILEAIDQRSQEAVSQPDPRWGAKLEGNDIEVRVWPLDHESVLFGESDGNAWSNPQGSIVDQVISLAVREENWEQQGCSECPARSLCPFYGDALWLRDSQLRLSFLILLRKAEVWSGQRIVLREALDLISTILVGSPSDFSSGSVELHPCEWVQNRTDRNLLTTSDWNGLLELVSHRIYQDIFGRTTPTGLRLDDTYDKRDSWVLSPLRLLGLSGQHAATAIEQVDTAFAKQAGAPRLCGRKGAISRMDPAIDTAWCERNAVLADCTMSEFKVSASAAPLELLLCEFFEELESAAQNLAPSKDPARAFAAIYRWASSLFHRFSALKVGASSAPIVMDDYLELLARPMRPINTEGTTTTLKDLMREATEDDRKFDLASNFTGALPALQVSFRPARPRNQSPPWPANDRLVVEVVSGGSSGSPMILPADVFVEMWRKYAEGAADWNVSPTVSSLMRLWRDDFVVSRGLFKGLQEVSYSGANNLLFEALGDGKFQVRPISQ
jgi:hypothetical protein